MMRKLSFLAFVLICTAFTTMPKGGVIGNDFPMMECENYNGKKVALPVETMGKYTLLGLAFSKGAELDLKTWISPIYNKFIEQTDNSGAGVFDVSTDYDINLFFIPMFTGANKIASKSSKDKIRSVTNKELFPYLLFYEGANNYKKELDFEKRDIPYFFVLDKKGKIVYATSGKYNGDKMEAIVDIIEEN